MNLSDRTRRIGSLEQALGDPSSEDSALSFSRSLELDEREALPEREYAALRDVGLQAHFVPSTLGGAQGDLDIFVLTLRTIFRRDPAIGLGFGMTSFMAALPVWQCGTQEQKLALAELLLKGKAVAVAFHEPAHGNDILASSFWARREGASFVLEGKKGLINNIARADAALLFARTAPAAGPRSHSLFLLTRQDLSAGTMHPRLRTLGVRACDLRGWSADGCRVPDSALVGGEGKAFDGISLAFQLSRAVIPGMVVGIADSAWRLCFGFLKGRKLYNKSALDLPLVQRDLGAVFVDILASDAASLSVARMAQALPEQLCLASAVLKAFEPSRMASVMKRLSVLLGARHYLREGEHAFFQKLARDLPVLLLGHASSDVCLSLVAFQLRQIARLAAQAGGPSTCAPADRERLEAVFRLNQALPGLDPGRLALGCQGRDLVLEALPGLLGQLSFMDGSGRSMHALGVLVFEGREKLLKEVREGLAALPADHPAWYSAAESYCRLYVAACILFSWHHNRGELNRLGGLGLGSHNGASGNYDLLFLRALEQTLGVENEDKAWVRSALDEMSQCAEAGLSVGLLRLQQARSAVPLETAFSFATR